MVGSLEQYALLHERSGQAIPEEASGTIALLLEGGVDATEGGVRQVRAVDIFSSIGFRGGVEDNVATAVVDLAPFFESRHSIREFSNRRAESGCVWHGVAMPKLELRSWSSQCNTTATAKSNASTHHVPSTRFPGPPHLVEIDTDVSVHTHTCSVQANS